MGGLVVVPPAGHGSSRAHSTVTRWWRDAVRGQQGEVVGVAGAEPVAVPRRGRPALGLPARPVGSRRGALALRGGRGRAPPGPVTSSPASVGVVEPDRPDRRRGRGRAGSRRRAACRSRREHARSPPATPPLPCGRCCPRQSVPRRRGRGDGFRRRYRASASDGGPSPRHPGRPEAGRSQTAQGAVVAVGVASAGTPAAGGVDRPPSAGRGARGPVPAARRTCRRPGRPGMAQRPSITNVGTAWMSISPACRSSARTVVGVAAGGQRPRRPGRRRGRPRRPAGPARRGRRRRGCR